MVEFSGAAVRTATDLPDGDLCKPPFHRVDPGSGRWGEVELEAGMTRKPVLHGRCLGGAVIVHDDVDRKLGWDTHVQVRQELQEFGGAMPTMQLTDDFSGSHVQRGKQRRRAVTQIVMGRRSGSPGVIGRIGWVRSRAWIWLFSSTHNTTALTGGFRYSSTMSRTLSTNSASTDSLNVS